jgi:hypothetical protein
LLTAVLRVFAMLVLNVVSTLQMIRRHDHVNATRAMPTILPRAKTDTIKDNNAAQHRSPPALILSSTQSVRPSKDEGVLTNASHKPAQHEHPNHLAPPSLRSSPRTPGPRASRVLRVTGLLTQPWLPACARKSGLVPPPNKNAAA